MRDTILMLILWSPGSQADQLSVWDAPQVCGGSSPDNQEPDPSLSKVGRLKLHVIIIMYVSLVGSNLYSMMGKKDVCTPCYFLVRYERYTCKECEVYICTYIMYTLKFPSIPKKP